MQRVREARAGASRSGKLRRKSRGKCQTDGTGKVGALGGLNHAVGQRSTAESEARVYVARSREGRLWTLVETETDATSEQEAGPERREEVLRVRSGA